MLKFREIRRALTAAKKHNTTLRRRLMGYFLSLILISFAALLLVLNITGIFSSARINVAKGLEIHLGNSVATIARDFEALSAQGISLSMQLSRIMDTSFIRTGESVALLNNNPDALLHIQEAVFEPLYSFLQMSDCSGVYFFLDATVNTSVPGADTLKSGVYLRFISNRISSSGESNTSLFRGFSSIARDNDIIMHNSWEMEMPSGIIPHFDDVMQNSEGRLADDYYWTEKISLPDAWENVIFLVVPVVGEDGTVYGVCGFEMNELHFRFANPIVESEFGPVTTVLAPQGDGELQVNLGLVGGVTNYLRGDELLKRKDNGRLLSYIADDAAFVGNARAITLSPNLYEGENGWVVAALLPMENYRTYFNRNRLILAACLLLLLTLFIAISNFLSNRYVRPISDGLLAIREEKADAAEDTGILELDALYEYLKAKPGNHPIGREELPRGIEELLNSFLERIQKLTASERNIFQYYIEGHEIAELPGLLYTSMSTVRKHNRSIYTKLEVASRDELMLYIDLLRRCGRLQDLYAIEA